MSELIDREALKDAVKRYAGEPIKEKDRKCQAICLDMLGTIDAQPAASPWHRVEGNGPHWVSVEERLPKETKLVVTYGKSRVSFGYNILLYDADADKEVVEWFDYCGNKENVTHWMPLPEPPKEEA